MCEKEQRTINYNHCACLTSLVGAFELLYIYNYIYIVNTDFNVFKIKWVGWIQQRNLKIETRNITRTKNSKVITDIWLSKYCSSCL